MGSCCLGNCAFGKLPLGKLHLGKCFWESMYAYSNFFWVCVFQTFLVTPAEVKICTLSHIIHTDLLLNKPRKNPSSDVRKKKHQSQLKDPRHTMNSDVKRVKVCVWKETKVCKFYFFNIFMGINWNYPFISIVNYSFKFVYIKKQIHKISFYLLIF